jgi:hypothetical protein
LSGPQIGRFLYISGTVKLWESPGRAGGLPKGIYPAFQYAFQNGGVGYMGSQSDSNGKRALFAIWDTAENSGSAQGAHSNCSRFGGEGTGATCRVNYPWVAGREYALRIWVISANSTSQRWGAWIIDMVTMTETLIGYIDLTNSNGYQGYGWLKNTSTVFLERYVSVSGGCSAQPMVTVVWRGPYANNNNGYGNGMLANTAVA